MTASCKEYLMSRSRKITSSILTASAALAAIWATPASSQTGFTDHAAIDAAIEAFTGAPAGAIGGARTPVDRRLRLAACRGELVLGFYGNRVDMLTVACSDAGSWRIFVALNSPASAAPVQSRAAEPVDIIARGDMVSIVVEGPGFIVQQAGEAMEAGAQGHWIRVRPAGTRETLRGRIDGPGKVTISRL